MKDLEPCLLLQKLFHEFYTITLTGCDEFSESKWHKREHSAVYNEHAKCI